MAALFHADWLKNKCGVERSTEIMHNRRPGRGKRQKLPAKKMQKGGKEHRASSGMRGLKTAEVSSLFISYCGQIAPRAGTYSFASIRGREATMKNAFLFLFLSHEIYSSSTPEVGKITKKLI